MDEITKEILEIQKEGAEQVLNGHLKANPGISNGEAALEAVLVYKSWFLPPPEWAVDEIAKCWNLYKEGREGLWGFVDSRSGVPVGKIQTCATLGEAFGIEAMPDGTKSKRSIDLANGIKRSHQSLLPKLRGKEVYRAVNILISTGKYTKSSEGENSAFEYLAKKMNVSVQTIIRDYYEIENNT